MTLEATRITLAERPTTHITSSTFKAEQVTIGTPSKGQVIVRVDYVSIDPAMRGWVSDKRSYLPPVQIGATMRSAAVGTVVQVAEEGVENVKVGDAVFGTFGWTDYALVDPKTRGLLFSVLTSPESTKENYIDALSDMVSFTAFFGLLDVGRVKEGETVVVSGAAGGVGTVAVQIAKIKGARVIGIAGGPDKCRYVEQELGADKCLDYKSADFKADFEREVGYLDVYFDNVGGDILDLCLSRLNRNARIAFCGSISSYNVRTDKGLMNYGELIKQRGTLQGFIVFDYASRYAEARQAMTAWKREGKLKMMKFHVEEGLERCPEHLGKVFDGVNTGKMIVKISAKEPGEV